MDGARSLVIKGELYLYGIIDPMSFGEPEFIRAIDVISSLVELGDANPVVVHINSPGGALFEGLAIYDSLKASGKRIIVKIEGLAASIASIIAMAGDEISMASGATMMIHNPWNVVAGDADDFRKEADTLERLGNRLAQIYAARTGRSAEEVKALMESETYFSADEAVNLGFADHVDEPMRVAAFAPLSQQNMARLLLAPCSIRPGETVRNIAAPAAPQTEGPIMANENQNDGGTAPTVSTAVSTQPQNAVAAPDLNAIRAETLRFERERVGLIRAAVRTAKLPETFADDMIRDGVSIDDARAKIIDKWGEVQNAAEGSNAPQRTAITTIVHDEIDRWAAGATAGLMARANLKGGEKNEFTGLSLSELARDSLRIRNVKPSRNDRMSMVGTAFTVRASGPGYHSTSDFGNVLGTVAARAMMIGYEEVDETFPLWTGKGTASDFRATSRVDLGLFPALDKVEEGAEYTYATLGDTGTVVQVATYGKIFAITRQAIVNDDLDFFNRVPRRMGRAAKRTIGNLVYAILNGNPTMQDSVALFHASHGNLATVAAVPSVTALGAAMASMAVQTDASGIGTGGGVVPKFLLLPPTLLMTANTILTSATIPGDAAQVANPVRGAVTPISDSRLSGTAWYLSADPAQSDTIEVTYLDGEEEPFLDQKEGWNVDGSEFKVRMDAGVKALHWRGMFKNAGV
jgi:ATP-dependent Clp endopeptidase proteolytic subunit ClpP